MALEPKGIVPYLLTRNSRPPRIEGERAAGPKRPPQATRPPSIGRRIRPFSRLLTRLRDVLPKLTAFIYRVQMRVARSSRNFAGACHVHETCSA
jgi:hypothetical protein